MDKFLPVESSIIPELRQQIHDLLRPTSRVSGTEWQANCPWCYERGKGPDTTHHFWVNRKTLLFQCYRCSVSGGLKFWLRLFGTEGYDFDSIPGPVDFVDDLEWDRIKEWLQDAPKSKVDAIPECEYPVGFAPIPLNRFSLSRNYLQSRGISDLDIVKYKLHYGVGAYSRRVIFPVFWNQKLVYWTARAIDSDTSHKYLNPPIDKSQIIFNLDRVDRTQPLFIIEGIISAIVSRQNAVALLGKTVPLIKIMMLVARRFPEYIVMLDGDAHAESDHLCETFWSWGCNVRQVKFPIDKMDPATPGVDVPLYISQSMQYPQIGSESASYFLKGY